MTEVSGLDTHLGYLLRQVSNHVSQSFARKVAGEGVTVAEWVVLRVLFERPPTPPSQVAELMGFTRGAVSKLADRLIAKGLVARAADAEDGRAQTLTLTAKGRRLTPKIAALADRNEAECFGSLTDEDARALRRILAATAAQLGLSAAPVD